MGNRPSIATPEEVECCLPGFATLLPDEAEIRVGHRRQTACLKKLQGVPHRTVRFSEKKGWQELWSFAVCSKHGKLWARLGSLFCGTCGRKLFSSSADESLLVWVDVPNGKRFVPADLYFEGKELVLANRSALRASEVEAVRETGAILGRRVLLDYRVNFCALGECLRDLPDFSRGWLRILGLCVADGDLVLEMIPFSPDTRAAIEDAKSMGSLFLIEFVGGGLRVLFDPASESARAKCPSGPFEWALFDRIRLAWNSETPNDVKRLLKLNSDPLLTRHLLRRMFSKKQTFDPIEE